MTEDWKFPGHFTYRNLVFELFQQILYGRLTTVFTARICLTIVNVTPKMLCRLFTVNSGTYSSLESLKNVHLSNQHLHQVTNIDDLNDCRLYIAQNRHNLKL